MKTTRNKKTPATLKKRRSRKNVTLVSLICVIGIITAVTVFFLMSSVFSTEKYYVLKQNIPAKQLITRELLVEKETTKGGRPDNAVTDEEVASRRLFSSYPLQAGDIISRSNVGPTQDTSAGIPDSWVQQTFTFSSAKSFGGKLSRGDFVDILGVSPDGSSSKYVLVNALLLDVDNGSTDTTNSKDGKQQASSSLQVTLGMPSDTMAKFISAVNTYTPERMYLNKSPLTVNYEKRKDLKRMKGAIIYDKATDEYKDLFKGSNPTFKPVPRDSTGRPVNKDNCEQGKISPERLCKTEGYDTSSSQDKDK